MSALLFAIFTALLSSYHLANAEYTPTKQDSGWVSLFNGKNLDGLHNHQSAFIVKDGALNCKGCDAGYIRTKSMYSHYHVRVSYQLTEKSNGGMLSHFTSDIGVGKWIWPTCLEHQIQDGKTGEFASIGYLPGKTPFLQGADNRKNCPAFMVNGLVLIKRAIFYSHGLHFDITLLVRNSP